MNLNRHITIMIGTASVLITQSSKIITSEDNKKFLICSGDLLTNDDLNSFGITSGTLNLEEILCDTEFSLRQLCSSKFEVQCFNLSTDVNGKPITVYCTENGVEIDLFNGVIESSTTDNFNGFRDIVAYDRIYTLRDYDVGSWWDTFWNSQTLYKQVTRPSGNPKNNNYHEKQADNSYILTNDTSVVSGKTYYHGDKVCTIGELRKSLFNHLELNCENDTLVNDSFQIKQYYKAQEGATTSLMFGELMSSLCEINGCIGRINRDGNFEFVTLSKTSSALGQYEKATVEFEDYTTSKITGINVYESTDALMRSYGSSDNAYVISGNIFTLVLDSYDILDLMCANILNNIKHIQYVPATIPLVVSNLNNHLGDCVTSDRGNHYVLSQTFSGSLLVDQTINCPAYGETLNQEVKEISGLTVLNKKYSSIKQTQDQIELVVADKLDKSTFNQFAQGIDMEFVTVGDSTYHKQLTTNITFNSEGINIKSNTDGVANKTQLQLTPNGAYIEDEQGEEVTSMTKNTFRTGEWVLQQTNDGKSFNIFKERRLG